MIKFWVDDKRNITKTYEELNRDLLNAEQVRQFIADESPYQIFYHIILGMLTGLNQEMLEWPINPNEIKNMGLEQENLNKTYPIEQALNNIDLENFALLISPSWRLAIYTSGTTGKPKKAIHDFKNLTRFVKTGPLSQENVWAFAYHPTHIAGLQVFLQAFLNKNTLVNIFDIEKSKIMSQFEENHVSHLSATPTYLRTVLPYLTRPLPKVKQITLGGEKFDKQLIPQIKSIFPNAKIKNIYALTEAGSLLSSRDDVFTISKEQESLIKITDLGELLVHKNLMGKLDQIMTKDDWYATGDLVEKINNHQFKFISRNNEMINVGGYKLNPHEVEDLLKLNPHVIDVLVYGKPNKITGNVVVAEIVSDNKMDNHELEKELQQLLEKHLQDWKKPRLFYFTQEIGKTRTGKKVRK
jgi:acyl-coenzyme A synthetase/AMP-(fatty) acid ligase